LFYFGTHLVHSSTSGSRPLVTSVLVFYRGAARLASRPVAAGIEVLLDGGVKFYAALGNHDDPNDERL